MTLKAFNLAILAGWLLVLVGGCLFNVALGLLLSGLLLLVLTFVMARFAGVYQPKKEEEGGN